MRKKPVFYSDEKKNEIIQEHLDGASIYSLVKKYNLGGTTQLYKWMRIFGVRSTSPREETIAPMEESEEIKRLKKELQQVRKDLAFERIRSKAFDAMIDIAEDRWKIEIRKKAGTKPSDDCTKKEK